jgi:protein-L-isoaspartate(D-aspartate) O-methyltransferase
MANGTKGIDGPPQRTQHHPPAYAKQTLAAATFFETTVHLGLSARAGIVDNLRLETALSATRREDFLGAGPWQIFRRFQEYVTTPDADPVYLYTDDLVGILPDRRLNNGQPSFLAYLIHQASPRAGEHVVHIGAGTGYYTAILAHIVGPSDRVTGIEYEPELAARAKTNFATWPNVDIVEGDGALGSFDTADVICVNAGCTRPVESWLERLADGGRLILPMTSDPSSAAKSLERMDFERAGAVFRIERSGKDYLARWISAVAIFPCAGNRDEASERALTDSFAKGGWRNVTRVYRNQEIPRSVAGFADRDGVSPTASKPGRKRCPIVRDPEQIC